MIPAQRLPGEREPETSPLKQMTTAALVDLIPQQRRRSPGSSPGGSSSLHTSPVSQTLPNPALVARMAPRPSRRLAGVLAVLGGAALAVVAILVLVMIVGSLI